MSMHACRLCIHSCFVFCLYFLFLILFFISMYIFTFFSSICQGGEVSYCDGTDVNACAILAASSEVAVVFAGTLSGEGSDRASLSLDDGLPINNQNELITKVSAAQPRTVVVLSVPGAILTPWAPQVPAIVTNFMAGQQCGNDVLLGKVNPSGKLPITFPNVENETHFSPVQWPGLPDAPLDPPKTDPRRLCEKMSATSRMGYTDGFDSTNPAAPPPQPTCKYTNYTGEPTVECLWSSSFINCRRFCAYASFNLWTSPHP